MHRQPEHTGTYICEAVGYPATTPGARVSVYLKVEPCKCQIKSINECF